MSGTTASVGGALLDRYAIERELGRGGMAVVHLAEEKKHARKVAIKILRPEGTEFFRSSAGGKSSTEERWRKRSD